MYTSLNFEADARPPAGSFLAPVQLRRLDQGEARGTSPPVQAVLSRGKLNDGRLPDGEMAANLEERDPQAVRSARVTVPSGASSDRDSWVAGTRPAAQSATGPDPGQNAGGADKRRNAMSGSYSDDALRDPRRYGIKNTTDKVRRPGAVRRRRDAVCSERVLGKPEVCRVISVDAKVRERFHASYAFSCDTPRVPSTAEGVGWL